MHSKYSDPEFDAYGKMFHTAKRAVQMCIDKRYFHNGSFENPKDMMKELLEYEKKGFKKRTVFERCDEILWNVCMIDDYVYANNMMGSMIDILDDINELLDQHDMEKEELQEKIDDIANDPDTFEVSGSKRGTKYLVNLEQGICTCPGFKFRGECKHLHMRKRAKKETNKKGSSKKETSKKESSKNESVKKKK